MSVCLLGFRNRVLQDTALSVQDKRKSLTEHPRKPFDSEQNRAQVGCGVTRKVVHLGDDDSSLLVVASDFGTRHTRALYSLGSPIIPDEDGKT